MAPETKSCQNCKAQFTIEPDDFAFYEKIKVPPPTFCPPCRYQRRLMVRNERNFYKRECGLCKKSVVAMYSPEKPFPVYCPECWWGDKWDPMRYGVSYDRDKPFFAQLRELQNKVPRPSLRATNCKNSEYCNYTADVKDSYLVFGSIEVENCMYGSPYESKYCVDTYLARECEYCYECTDCEKLSNSAYAQDCAASLNLLYCVDCKNCQDCIGCAGLRNKSYHIFNVSYTKEEYMREKERIIRGGRATLEEVRKKFEAVKQKMPRRFNTALQCVSVSGDHIVQSKNARNCFDVKRVEDCAYCIRMIDAKDTHDTNYCEYVELCYDYLGFWKVARSKFSNTCGEGSELEYADFCSSASNLFGCVGLRNKQYCILNMQYSKEEYERVRVDIVAHMNAMPFVGKNGRTYRYGEYFPAELSLLAYNETVAQDFFPLLREAAIAAGFEWKDTEMRNYAVTRTPTEITPYIEDVADAITKEVIGCIHKGVCNHLCTTAFRVIPEELQFYRRMRLPLPLMCPNCRHYERLARRNPLKLWHRQCMCNWGAGEYKNTGAHSHGENPCPNEFETPYAPERKEIVYCEQCYNAEIV